MYKKSEWGMTLFEVAIVIIYIALLAYVFCLRCHRGFIILKGSVA